MDLVQDKLWLGSLNAALSTELLKEKGISHIVTVNINPLPAVEGFTYFFIRAQDDDSEDLLSHFEKAFEFIDTGLLNSSILVHCHHGVSRSATIIIGYLMYKHGTKLKETLERVQLIRPVQPNAGFINQLKLFETLHSCKKMNSIVIQWYQLQLSAKLVSNYWESAHNFSRKGCSWAEDMPALKCKKCRQPLAHRDDIIDHQPGHSPNWSDEKWVEFCLNNHVGSSICKMAFFVLPLAWMELGNSLQGKLACPKCKSKIGAFNWSQNIQCPCQASFRPGFYLQASRVDLTQYTR